MKRTVSTILLLLIFLCSFGQRIVSTDPFVYVRYAEESSNYVVSVPGSGESGLADASQIYKVEAYGYAKQAKAGFEPPFNLLVTQGLPGYGMTDWSKVFPSYGCIFQGRARTGKIYDVLPDDGELVGIGWSQGAAVMINQLFDPLCEFDAMIIIAGKASGTPDWTKAKDIPLIFVHGDKDTSIGITQSRNMVAALNKTDRKNKAILLELVGGSHSGAMNAAYDINHPIGKQVYQLILDTFKPDHTTGIFVDGVWIGDTSGTFEGHTIEIRN